ncbi:MAG TPA: hypothetical protein VFQ53_29055 [Kofleriaceae bacterium]|nr:hypothetical protein [Kofleriaceae bacterium]
MLRGLALASLLAYASACSSVSTVRVQPEHVHVAPNLRPVAIIHAQVTRGYLMFIPFGGEVNLDRVVNRMLLATAKALGADKVVDIKVDITPDGGIWTLRKVIGWQSAEASGIAVMVEDTAPPPASSPAPVPPAKATP